MQTYNRLQPPSTSLALLPPVRVRLPDQDDFRILLLIHRIPALIIEVGRSQHVAQDGISRLQDGSQVRSRVIDDVRIHGSSDGRNLSIGQQESTALRRLRWMTRWFNVENDKLGRLLNVGQGREWVAPVVIR